MLTRLLNLLFPPQCLTCRAMVPTHGTLCLPCWQQVQFITEPCCQCCGYPFDFAMGSEAMCAECLRERPPFARARSAIRYNDASRPLILRLKYQDQTYLARIYGPWLASAGRTLVESSDIIVPVPLHYWRFVRRRYNQSALLAQALARECALPVLVDALKRTRHTPPQAGLQRKDRLTNVKNAFVASKRGKAAIKGKTVLLVDDVMTTRATIDECTRALLKAGAQCVNIVTLGRTVS